MGPIVALTQEFLFKPAKKYNNSRKIEEGKINGLSKLAGVFFFQRGVLLIARNFSNLGVDFIKQPGGCEIRSSL
jgi:hypothetical protein